MKRILLVSSFVAAALAGAAPVHAEVPATVPFAGRLVRDGTPVSGNQTIRFRFYDAQVDGTAVWDETHIGLGVEDGLVYARLGTLTDLDPTIFEGSLFLEVTITDATGPHSFLPRLPIESVPYALHAGVADAIGGYSADDLQPRIDGSCAVGSAIRAIGADGAVTCEIDDDANSGGTITGVTAGTGLTGGGASGAVSLAVNTAVVQSRIGGSCSAGQSIRAIGVDGTVTCEADDDTNSGGTITGVSAGTGLTGGGASGAVSLAINTAVVQSRVGGACSAGQSIRAIGVDGTVTCEADDDTNSGGTITGVTAGTGLTGGGASGGVSLAINPAAVQSRVSGSCAAGQAVRSIAQDGTVTCEPKASRTYLGDAPISVSPWSGTPTSWVQISQQSFDLTYAFSYAADFLKPSQPMQVRMCAFFTDAYEGATNVHFRIRRHDNPTIVHYTLDSPNMWSGEGLYRQACGPWVASSVLQACTAGFAQGTCSLDFKHDTNAHSIVREVTLQMAGVN